jgi:putative two-component system response regulator
MRKEIIRNSRILFIDDQPEIIVVLQAILHQGGYVHLKGITDSRNALTAFSDFCPDLVALDLRMPNVDGFALLKQFRSRIPQGALVPVLVFTADSSRNAREQALSLGAKDFVTKPLDATEVRLRIYNLLETRWSYSTLQQDKAALEEKVRDRTRDLQEAQLEILQRLARAAEYRDDCTGQHTMRVSHLAGLLGRAIGLPAEHLELLRRAAPLHDVGKIGIPDAILLKPGKLTEEEYIQIKTHTEIGCMILSGSKFPILQMAERIALYHHERWDGDGYHGLIGDAIPLEARIVSLVDAFDVITHARPYKEAETAAAAMECIVGESGKQFDPALVDVFTQLQPSEDLGRLSEAIGHGVGVSLQGDHQPVEFSPSRTHEQPVRKTSRALQRQNLIVRT